MRKHIFREGETIEIDYTVNVALDDARIVLQPESGDAIAFLLSQGTKVSESGGVHYYRDSELPRGEYVYEWHGIKAGIVIDTYRGEGFIVKDRLLAPGEPA